MSFKKLKAGNRAQPSLPHYSASLFLNIYNTKMKLSIRSFITKQNHKAAIVN